MKLSALTSSLPTTLPAAIVQIAQLGFSWIDIPAIATDSPAARLLREKNLQVGCVALEKGQQTPIDLAGVDRDLRIDSVTLLSRAIATSAELRAPVCYLTPPKATDNGTRDRWTDSLIALADEAGARSMKLCIEHFPGRLLATAEATLTYLRDVNHDALSLLLDVGHCLISREDPASVIENAGDRLGYVHFDDNDGIDDLHWPLLTGQLTGPQVRRTILAARRVGYTRAFCLELNRRLDDPLGNLRKGKEILEQFDVAYP